MTEGLQISAELGICEARLAVLDKMLSDIEPGDKATADYLNGRRTEWLRYRAGLLIVRDERPAHPKSAVAH